MVDISCIMLMKLQELCKNCASLVRHPVISFWRKVAKFLHSSCARVLFYLIANAMGKPLKGKTLIQQHIRYCDRCMHKASTESPVTSYVACYKQLVSSSICCSKNVSTIELSQTFSTCSHLHVTLRYMLW